ncbi:LysR family transcriptional regulator [Myxococcus llanfairpwllgwyngyllgogerychwyrndrobwllllantysiliogogogochensis]|uniref:LysR family transcriptional regulator n=1 Tax=Myxococcus llanfairpwllgwyngyllgogerychwyrndrobwllllantysiliogogogochensis TaxID=2590453 RepID=A0A540X4M9_9BACT|nr:LysR family transcriptional regulator [Myxococcus llanfairpwllgwyngyllgogerychwyrndrobwllllantysiliogogogochensis]TQF16205.1 LysR family transcriptional regulator [Myxococcus llanfairpwllgwyngyllgogerychwyrndrobwllllantysiliogogogochensis]
MSLPSLSNIDAFVRAVEDGNFTQAARRLHITASAVSRRIARLEEELGVRLFQRTTRALRLTDDGRDFYARCQHILAELGEAKESLARSRNRPTGRLRVEVPQVIGQLVLTPALPRFLQAYPGIELHLTMRDEVVDPITEGADVLIRMGPLTDSRLVARSLAMTRMVAVAAPDYLKQHGTPAMPSDLSHHQCLGFLRQGVVGEWRFKGPEGITRVAPRGAFHVSQGATLRDAAAMGLGIAWMMDFMVTRELATGALVTVLDTYAGEERPIYLLHPPGRHLPSRVRVFLDFVKTLFAHSRAAHSESSAP